MEPHNQCYSQQEHLGKDYEDAHIPQDRVEREIYIKRRVINKIQFWDKRAARFRKKYHWLGNTNVFLPLSIPLIALLCTILSIRTDLNILVLSFIATAVAAINGVLSLGHYKGEWLRNRYFAVKLDKELFQFQGRAGVYLKFSDTPEGNDNAYKLFVERIEYLIGEETDAWMNYHNQSEASHCYTSEKRGSFEEGPASFTAGEKQEGCFSCDDDGKATDTAESGKVQEAKDTSSPNNEMSEDSSRSSEIDAERSAVQGEDNPKNGMPQHNGSTDNDNTNALPAKNK